MTKVIEGPLRKPAQMLADQSYDGHSSIHDDAEAEKLGIRAGPIEGPTHFSQFSPHLVDLFGKEWFERGCFSTHFQNMVVEGEEVRVFIEPKTNTYAYCRAEKADGTPVLEASATLGPDHGETLLAARMAKLRPAGDLVILADMETGMTGPDNELVKMDPDQHMGDLYPFSLTEKLEKITEPMDWYSDASASPWGRTIVPTEMVSVLGNYTGGMVKWPVKRPSIGLFADLEIKMVNGPLFVGETYRLKREVVALSQSRRVENYWVLTSFYDEGGSELKAQMLLNHGVMKASYPDYPKELLA
ncbi:hypothetical protein [Henriciella algicola]|uniref:N-terminal of MaoC-like dehydratase domain-containing protein n=1 Tax=Henriciella algicola TaxID=1608422 RepID=A0A399RBJ0_9PROT|nr:hypothetical protein [Henriciella algicola]RIJ28840.1 hypothetical protein D1222_10710 [Henriciella algicola]